MTDFSQVTDKLGKKIDPEILDLVIKINQLGFVTFSSCAGHLDREPYSPWIMFQPKNGDQIGTELRDITKLLKGSEKPTSNQEALNKLDLYHQKKAEIRKPLLEEAKKFTKLLDKFYEKNNPSERLIATTGSDYYRLEFQNSVFEQIEDRQVISNRLIVQRSVLNDFLAFLNSV